MVHWIATLYSIHLPGVLTMYRLLILLVVSGWLIPPGLARDTQPNVILVITDDQGYGDVGAHGNTMIQTPNLDHLYSQSVRLTDLSLIHISEPTRPY